jgi:hypothetical protein
VDFPDVFSGTFRHIVSDDDHIARNSLVIH